MFSNIAGVNAWCSVTEDKSSVKDYCWRVSIRSKEKDISSIGHSILIADDGDIIWDGSDAGRVDGAEGVFPVFFHVCLSASAEFDLDGMLWVTDFEDEAIGKPLIRKLGLGAINEFLAEETVFVTDGVSV